MASASATPAPSWPKAAPRCCWVRPCRSGFSRELLPLPLPLRRLGEGRAPPLRRPAIIPRMDKQPTTPRRALVTGGSGDLGGAICRHLAADGPPVIVHANANPPRAEPVSATIAAADT